jgi:hypothetical protein
MSGEASVLENFVEEVLMELMAEKVIHVGI